MEGLPNLGDLPDLVGPDVDKMPCPLEEPGVTAGLVLTPWFNQVRSMPWLGWGDLSSNFGLPGGNGFLGLVERKMFFGPYQAAWVGDCPLPGLNLVVRVEVCNNMFANIWEDKFYLRIPIKITTNNIEESRLKMNSAHVNHIHLLVISQNSSVVFTFV